MLVIKHKGKILIASECYQTISKFLADKERDLYNKIATPLDIVRYSGVKELTELNINKLKFIKELEKIKALSSVLSNRTTNDYINITDNFNPVTIGEYNIYPMKL